MWEKALGFIKGLFIGGKGTGTGTQIGSRNKAMSIGGNAEGVIFAEHVHVNHAPNPETDESVEFSPTKEEAEILVGLLWAQNKVLHAVKVDSWAGSMILVDCKQTADTDDTDACRRYYEAFIRLKNLKLINNPSGDGQVYLLSSEGERLARVFERECTECGKKKRNLSTAPGQPPEWVCTNSECLNSKHHKNAKCPTCGKEPDEIVGSMIAVTGKPITSYLCHDGHEFTRVSS